MPEPFDPGPAAELLARTWRAGAQLTELPAAIRPSTLEEGYDVQDRLIDLLSERVTGWKLGLGGPSAKRRAGLERAIAGRVLAPSSHRDGETVRLGAAGPATVEFEIAFVLDRDIDPGTTPEPLDVVGAIHVAFELVQARYVDRRAVGWPSFAADDAAYAALVVGEAIARGDVDEVGRSVVVSVDGTEKARRVPDDDLIDPLVALAELLAHARERGLTLRRGDIVATGTLSAPFNVAPSGVEVAARYLESELRFSLAGPAG